MVIDMYNSIAKDGMMENTCVALLGNRKDVILCVQWLVDPQ